MTPLQWTAEEVRKELPDIPVIAFGKEQKAQVGGRLNPFATVSLAGVSVEYSWDALATVLSSGKPLQWPGSPGETINLPSAILKAEKAELRALASYLVTAFKKREYDATKTDTMFMLDALKQWAGDYSK